MDQALYEETYRDIEKQLFPHGLPEWATEEGRRRAHYRLAEVTRCAMSEMGRLNGDPRGEARRATGDKVTDR